MFKSVWDADAIAYPLYTKAMNLQRTISDLIKEGKAVPEWMIKTAELCLDQFRYTPEEIAKVREDEFYKSIARADAEERQCWRPR